MRLYYVVLLAAATLLVSINAVSTTVNSEPNSASKITSFEAPRGLVAPGPSDGTTKRLLRSTDARSEGDRGVEEERVNSLVVVNAVKKFTKKAGIAVKDRFQLTQWMFRNKKPEDVRKILKIPLDATASTHPKYPLYKEFIRWYQQ